MKPKRTHALLASFALALGMPGVVTWLNRQHVGRVQETVELTLAALAEHNLANEVVVSAYLVKPVDFQRFVEAIKQLGYFWAVLNEPPPGSVRKS